MRPLLPPLQILAALALAVSAGAQTTDSISIIPRPVSVTPRRGAFTLTSRTAIWTDRADSAVATIWLVFYILALGVAIASPIVFDTLTVAAR